ncbi:hypothetical protein DFJ77DRAFT_448605 [Powellomyces hirtus]|nr:hypothetical protein DFJ77DRAFT_448605 [Powellomyces hirtus]
MLEWYALNAGDTGFSRSLSHEGLENRFLQATALLHRTRVRENPEALHLLNAVWTTPFQEDPTEPGSGGTAPDSTTSSKDVTCVPFSLKSERHKFNYVAISKELCQLRKQTSEIIGEKPECSPNLCIPIQPTFTCSSDYGSNARWSATYIGNIQSKVDWEVLATAREKPLSTNRTIISSPDLPRASRINIKPCREKSLTKRKALATINSINFKVAPVSRLTGGNTKQNLSNMPVHVAEHKSKFRTGTVPSPNRPPTICNTLTAHFPNPGVKRPRERSELTRHSSHSYDVRISKAPVFVRRTTSSPLSAQHSKKSGESQGMPIPMAPQTIHTMLCSGDDHAKTVAQPMAVLAAPGVKQNHHTIDSRKAPVLFFDEAVQTVPTLLQQGTQSTAVPGGDSDVGKQTKRAQASRKLKMVEVAPLGCQDVSIQCSPQSDIEASSPTSKQVSLHDTVYRHAVSMLRLRKLGCIVEISMCADPLERL